MARLVENFNITQDGALTMKGRICVPDDKDLRNLIMKEAHCSAYAMHPGNTKMYQTIKENYQWPGMKKDIRVKMFSVPTGEDGTSKTF